MDELECVCEQLPFLLRYIHVSIQAENQ